MNSDQISQKNPWFQYPVYCWNKKTVTIIGAGIAGSQIAWHLAKRDWQVTVIERHLKPAQEASGNLAGIISPKITAKPSLGEDFYLQCFQYTLNQLNGLNLKNAVETTANVYSTESKGFLENVDFTRRMTTNKAKIFQKFPYLQHSSHSRYVSTEFSRLKNTFTKTPNWNPVGVLQLAYNERDQARWEQLKERGFCAHTLQCLDSHAASQLANVAINYPAVYFPKAGWVEPKSFCQSLLNHKNITLITHTEAMDIQLGSNKQQWEVSDATGDKISVSEALIICSGKDLNFTPIKDLPSVAIAGQTSLATCNQNEPLLKTVLDHEGYITPAINQKHQLLFGATYDLDSQDDSLTEEANQQNLDKLRKHLPELADSLSSISFPKSGHAAIRKVTPDRLPYLGAVPDISAYQEDYADLHHGKHWKHYPKASYYPKLFISAAYGSRGLTTSALCAEILACIMNNETIPVKKSLLDALHPARFCIRELKRK